MDADRKVNTVVINHCLRSEASLRQSSPGKIPGSGRDGATRTAEFILSRLFLPLDA